MRITSLFWKLFLTCILTLLLSHAILDVTFAVLFQNNLTNIHLNAADLAHLTYLFAWSTLLSLLITSIVTFYLSQRLTAPLREMKRVALQIARGRFDQRVVVKTRDEVGTLGETFNYMAGELAGLDQMRKDFVANVSHDLRSPLTSLHGFIRAFQDEAIPESRKRHALQVMEEQTMRMTRLVNDLLDLSRIEAGQLEIHPVAFNLSELVRQVVARLDPELVQNQLQVEVLPEEAEDIFVCADPDRIDQVLVNVLQNAIHFSPPGSSIEMLLNQEDQAVIALRDHGPGIKPEDLALIWERFYKADRARTKKAGTGLGLSIVKHILLLHHTDMQVASEVGRGTTFTFTLPLAKPTSPK